MESMPFLHAGQIFTIIFEDDLTFSEVRTILDHLLSQEAFMPEAQQEEGFYPIDLGYALFQVWVVEMDVIIRKQ